MKKYNVGDLTYQRVFKENGITNLSDLQAIMDATERALSSERDVDVPDLEPNVQNGKRRCELLMFPEWRNSNDDHGIDADTLFHKLADHIESLQAELTEKIKAAKALADAADDFADGYIMTERFRQCIDAFRST